MIKNVMFDIDGTLMDTEAVFCDSLKGALEFCGYPVPENKLIDFFGKTGSDAADALGISRSDEIFAQKWQDLFEEMSKEQPLFDGIAELLKALNEKSIEIVLVSSRNHQSADLLPADDVYGKYIKGCVAAEDTQRHKPFPDPMLKACELYGFLPQETIYIGDTVNDYKAAAAAGLTFAFAAWNKKAKRFDCELAFETPEDVLAYCFR